jgi:excisionase family DNA binding protein
VADHPFADPRPRRPLPEPVLLDPIQAAAMINIGERKLWELTKSGDIPSRKIGRLVRYSVAELEDWIARGCPCGNASDPDGGKGARRGSS